MAEIVRDTDRAECQTLKSKQRPRIARSTYGVSLELCSSNSNTYYYFNTSNVLLFWIILSTISSCFLCVLLFLHFIVFLLSYLFFKRSFTALVTSHLVFFIITVVKVLNNFHLELTILSKLFRYNSVKQINAFERPNRYWNGLSLCYCLVDVCDAMHWSKQCYNLTVRSV